MAARNDLRAASVSQAINGEEAVGRRVRKSIASPLLATCCLQRWGEISNAARIWV